MPPPLTVHVPLIMLPLFVPEQVAGTPVAPIPRYVKRSPSISPLVERAPDVHVTCVIEQPVCAISHESPPHVPDVVQCAARLAQLAVSSAGPLLFVVQASRARQNRMRIESLFWGTAPVLSPVRGARTTTGPAEDRT
ncbi:MAG TPA: hypothetical protein VHW23_42485 [Kofleriaceae bacterium]|nr:hypothetical protein [Kofleriaceae bacterium]